MSPLGSAPERTAPQRVAAIIPAHNVGRDVASTVRACRAIPGVDLLIVVDDGSDDDTGRSARAAGAVVVRHSVYRGRASAVETGVKVAAMRDRADWPPRLLLILSPDLGESAVESTALVEAVMTGEADCACAVSATPGPKKGRIKATKMARRVIKRMTGWEPSEPLSPHRCATREAITAAMPFMNGFGLELAMTIDVLAAGLSMVEVPCSFEHSGADRTIGEFNARTCYAEVLIAAGRKRAQRVRVPHGRRPVHLEHRGVGGPYPLPAHEREESGRTPETTS